MSFCQISTRKLHPQAEADFVPGAPGPLTSRSSAFFPTTEIETYLNYGKDTILYILCGFMSEVESDWDFPYFPVQLLRGTPDYWCACGTPFRSRIVCASKQFKFPLFAPTRTKTPTVTSRQLPTGSLPLEQHWQLPSHERLNVPRPLKVPSHSPLAATLLGILCDGYLSQALRWVFLALRMRTFLLGVPEGLPTASICFKTSKESSVIFPKTTWRPSSQGVATVVMKN